MKTAEPNGLKHDREAVKLLLHTILLNSEIVYHLGELNSTKNCTKIVNFWLVILTSIKQISQTAI